MSSEYSPANNRRGPRRKFTSLDHLDLQRGVDDSHLIAAAMRRGQLPPAYAVLDELEGIRRYFVDAMRRVVNAIREGASEEQIKDKAEMFAISLDLLCRSRDGGPCVASYLFERWPILDDLLSTLSLAYVPIADQFGLWIGGKRPPDAKKVPWTSGALHGFEQALDHLENHLDRFQAVIDTYGIKTSDERPKQQEPSEQTATETLGLDNEGIQVLCALASAAPRLLVQEDIAIASYVTRKVVRSRLKDLAPHHLVIQPQGPKGGWIITPKGIDTLKGLKLHIDAEGILKQTKQGLDLLEKIKGPKKGQ